MKLLLAEEYPLPFALSHLTFGLEAHWQSNIADQYREGKGIRRSTADIRFIVQESKKRPFNVAIPETTKEWKEKEELNRVVTAVYRAYDDGWATGVCQHDRADETYLPCTSSTVPAMGYNVVFAVGMAF